MTNTKVEMSMNDALDKLIQLAIEEDIATGDITTEAIIPKDMQGSGLIKAKQNLILAGLKVAEKVFQKIDSSLEWKPNAQDGDELMKGAIIAEVKGSLASILMAERIALNFLQHLSGIATFTNKFADIVCNTGTAILDTRKTTPGYRMLEKEAVRLGDGVNHRLGLYDSYLIKDNHITAAGSITEAIKKVNKKRKPTQRIEVEAKNLAEVEEALKAGAQIIMLDNFTPEKVKEAVDLVAGKIKLEVSGNISLTNINGYVTAGVDFISIGAITHSAHAADIHMKITLKS